MRHLRLVRREWGLGGNAFYSEILMFQLGSIVDDIESPMNKAYAIMVMIAVGGEAIQESFLRMLICNIKVDQVILRNALAWFSGMGYINLLCDCDGTYCYNQYIREGMWYQRGSVARAQQTDEYLDIKDEIHSLRAEIANCV